MILCLVIGLLLNILGCSSRGSAPVYSRSEPDVPAKVAAARKSRPPAYPRTYYLVQKGDTLYSIAWRYDLAYQQLARWNGISAPAYQIYPGQRLRLKPHEPSRRQTKQATPSVKSSNNRQPTVSQRSPAGKQPAAAKPVNRKTEASKAQKPKKRLKLTWNWPTKGKVVQTFSRKDSTRKGIWIAGRSGQPVRASAPGKVVYAGNGLVGYGNLVIIKHDQSYLSAYGYNSKLLVNEGDAVKSGETVAYMGSPNSGSQPLLHFEVRKKGKPVNPLPLLPRR